MEWRVDIETMHYRKDISHYRAVLCFGNIRLFHPTEWYDDRAKAEANAEEIRKAIRKIASGKATERTET